MARRTKRYEITALAYDKRGRLLSVGHNSYTRTHRLQAHYTNLSGGHPSAIYLHAELCALIKARKRVHKLVVLRFNKDGSPALAKPCPACQLAIRHFNVKHVEYSTNEAIRIRNIAG